jgi:hypothetical protein
MKIPGTPRRMEYTITGALENFTHSMEELSATFTVTAEQFNTSFREAFGLNDIDWKEEANRASIRVIEKTQDEYEALSDEEKNNGALYFIDDKSEPQARLIPIICKCCGGRIGQHDTCEYCGTRYII